MALYSPDAHSRCLPTSGWDSQYQTFSRLCPVSWDRGRGAWMPEVESLTPVPPPTASLAHPTPPITGSSCPPLPPSLAHPAPPRPTALTGSSCPPHCPHWLVLPPPHCPHWLAPLDHEAWREPHPISFTPTAAQLPWCGKTSVHWTLPSRAPTSSSPSPLLISRATGNSITWNTGASISRS